jgi:carboxyl-terminal processing protease
MKKSLLFSTRHTLVFSLLLFFTVASCREDDPSPGSQNAKVNDWILENMQFWYLWNEQLPGNPDKNTDPESFFESLLVSEDRFSWIQDDYQELLNSLQGISKEAGYEFALYRETEGSENVIGQVVYTKPSSPAVQAGLKRGDVFTHVNGQQLTTANYQSLLEAIHENHSLTYKPLIIAEERFDAARTISLSTVEYAEDPSYYHSVIEMDGKKIGYYVYNFFASGTDSDTTVYDTEMRTIFADFKAQGITDFVLDLRFNSGGSEKAAATLASLIGKDINDTKVFARRAYNRSVENEILNDPRLGEEFLSTRFNNESGNIGSLLSRGRVYVLTSSRTASASELVINALKPFMEVYLIGDVTYGKNVGSISLFDKTDASNKWGLQPIVVKVYNSLDQSDYASGFTPDVLHDDNGLYLYPLGDTHEALLALAIGHITGTSSSGRVAARNQRMKSLVGHSLDEKRRSFNLVIDQNIPFRKRQPLQ